MATIGLLHPGDMGSVVGACAVAAGSRVLWASEQRSASSRERAAAAGLEDAVRLAAVVAASDVVISVCPPAAALDLAREVAALRFPGLFVDANAVSPQTACQIGAAVEAGGAVFVDGGLNSFYRRIGCDRRDRHGRILPSCSDARHAVALRQQRAGDAS